MGQPGPCLSGRNCRRTVINCPRAALPGNSLQLEMSPQQRVETSTISLLRKDDAVSEKSPALLLPSERSETTKAAEGGKGAGRAVGGVRWAWADQGADAGGGGDAAAEFPSASTASLPVPSESSVWATLFELFEELLYAIIPCLRKSEASITPKENVSTKFTGAFLGIIGASTLASIIGVMTIYYVSELKWNTDHKIPRVSESDVAYILTLIFTPSMGFLFLISLWLNNVDNHGWYEARGVFVLALIILPAQLGLTLLISQTNLGLEGVYYYRIDLYILAFFNAVGFVLVPLTIKIQRERRTKAKKEARRTLTQPTGTLSTNQRGHKFNTNSLLAAIILFALFQFLFPVFFVDASPLFQFLYCVVLQPAAKAAMDVVVREAYTTAHRGNWQSGHVIVRWAHFFSTIISAMSLRGLVNTMDQRDQLASIVALALVEIVLRSTVVVRRRFWGKLLLAREFTINEWAWQLQALTFITAHDLIVEMLGILVQGALSRLSLYVYNVRWLNIRHPS